MPCPSLILTPILILTQARTYIVCIVALPQVDCCVTMYNKVATTIVSASEYKKEKSDFFLPRRPFLSTVFQDQSAPSLPICSLFKTGCDQLR